MKKILLVDDRSGFRKQFKRLPVLKNNSNFYISAEANDGAEAFDILQSETIDVVISDIRMPVMNGLELLCKINSADFHPYFIILSEYGTFEYAQKAIELGAYGYLTKPVDNEEVACLFERLLCSMEQSQTISGLTYDNAEEFCQLLLRNSMDSEKYLYTIFKPVESTSDYEFSLIADRFLRALHDILQKEIPWIFPFISPRIFNISFETSCTIDILVSHCITLQKQLNKFQFDFDANSTIRNICVFILQNIKNPELNLSFIANEFYFNKSYLSQLFKDKMNQNLIKFITYAKMEYAAVVLEDPACKISELSQDLGFENTDYFSNVFKKQFGFSPNIYQKRMSSHPKYD